MGGAGCRPSSGCAGTALPFPAQQAVKPCVGCLVIYEPTFPQMVLLLKAEPLERSDGSLVTRVNVGFKAIQIQPLESIMQERLQRFGHIPNPQKGRPNA